MRRGNGHQALSWKDVEEALIHLQKEAQCRADINIYTASLGIHKEYGLVVKLTLTVTEGGGGRGCVRAIRRHWPTYQVRTMPALIVALVYDALDELEVRPLVVGKQLKSGAYPQG